MVFFERTSCSVGKWDLSRAAWKSLAGRKYEPRRKLWQVYAVERDEYNTNRRRTICRRKRPMPRIWNGNELKFVLQSCTDGRRKKVINSSLWLEGVGIRNTTRGHEPKGNYQRTERSETLCSAHIRSLFTITPIAAVWLPALRRRDVLSSSSIRLRCTRTAISDTFSPSLTPPVW